MILKFLLNTQIIWTIFIKNVEEYNPNKKRKLLIVFDYMIADMVSNKKLNTIATELFIRGRKLNISLVFITQSYFAVPKNIQHTISLWKLQTNGCFNKSLQFNHSPHIDFQDFMNLYKKMHRKTIFLFSCWY